ncbi:MgtC/SapB family protein [Defluviitalea phaphyphila]|uniref:MgtC/SapB family protein n=1 Tax=Defluviitalea phaphyphila TaxID=1473580 RepID=UPI0007305888|nr:MgtC/SapB family protein [Defluviitalea phaphyphila]
MNENIFTLLKEVNTFSVIVRLTLAVICGGIIGMERERKNRAAGFKTHILVCIGSSLTMITNQYIVESLNVGGDPSRLGAQVISGIGFLGAGTILLTGKHQVKGLTTAAGLWASACMGLAIGIGFYEGAIISCAFIFGVMTILNKVDNQILSKSKLVDLYIELNSGKYLRKLIKFLKNNNLEIIYMDTNKDTIVKEGNLGCFITIKQPQKKHHEELLSLIGGLEGVEFIEEL